MSLPSQPTVLSLTNQTVTVYRYEPFWFRVYAPQPEQPGVGFYFTQFSQPTSAGLTSATYSIGTVYNSGTGQFTSILDVYGFGLNIAPGTETFTLVYIVDIATNTTQTFTYTVSVQAGRFFPPASNSSYTFYKNEPIQPNTILFTAPFEVSTPTSAPTLPPGISFTAVNPTFPSSYYLSGTPLAQLPSSNYQIIGTGIGSNAGRVVTTRVNIGVGDERVGLFVTGGSEIVNNMLVGSPIATRTITANYPFQASSNLLYTWTALPNGINFTDASGNAQSSGFIPADVSGTLLLSGTPTLAAAKSLASNGLSNLTTTLTGTRITSPNITSNIAFTFSFQETVLFDDVTVPTLYVGVPLTATGISFRARTFFPSGALITSMTAPSLPAGLSLNFVSGDQRGYLVGTPSSPVSASYSIIATNSNAVSRTLSVPINVVDDTVTFDYAVTPAIDTCYNFILSRPVTTAKTGYYPGSIRFRATAASGANVTMSATGLSGTGLSLSNVGSNTFQLIGFPEIVESLKTLTVTANSVSTPSSNTTTIKYETLNEVFTWSSVPASNLTFIQNKTITPIQLVASTLSERPVIGYSRVSGPTGINVSSFGVISGTPVDVCTNGAITVAATTGYATGTNGYNFTTRSDDTVIAGGAAVQTGTGDFSNVIFRVIRYSGTPASFVSGPVSILRPYQNVEAPIDLSITSSGTLSANLTATTPLLPEYGFTLFAAGSGAFQNIFASTSNPTTFHRYIYTADNSTVYVTDNTIAPFYPFDYDVTYPVPSLSFNDAWTPSNVLFTPNPADLATMSNTNGSNLFAIRPTSNVTVFSLRNALFRSSNQSSFTKCAFTDISSSTFVGPIIGVTPFPTTYIRLSNPIYDLNILYDGQTTWIQQGVGSPKGVAWPNGFNQVFLRTSTDNGLTWVADLSASPVAVPGPGESSTLVYGGNGRFFANVGVFGSSNLHYATASNLSNWSNVLAVNVLRMAHGSSSNELVALGDDKSAYRSTDNGDTWSNVITSADSMTAVAYGNGTWLVTNATSNLYVSTNGTTWSNYTYVPITGGFTVCNIAYDGASWLFSTTKGVFAVDLSQNMGSFGTVIRVPTIQTPTDPIFVSNVNPTNPSLTFRVLSSSNISFVEPYTTQFFQYQYIPIDTINIRAIHVSNVAPFIYYFAVGLPRGLTMNLDLSGISATITGTPTQFLDAAREDAVIIAKGYNDVVGQTLSFNTLIPRVVRQQSAASGYTSLLRQYVETNAAQNAVNQRALPNQERRLGEFMAPEAPDVVTQTVPPYCFDPNCKTNNV
jgi:hypothetical protein